MVDDEKKKGALTPHHIAGVLIAANAQLGTIREALEHDIADGPRKHLQAALERLELDVQGLMHDLGMTQESREAVKQAADAAALVPILILKMQAAKKDAPAKED